MVKAKSAQSIFRQALIFDHVTKLHFFKNAKVHSEHFMMSMTSIHLLLKKVNRAIYHCIYFLVGMQLWKCLMNVSLIKSTMPSCQQLSTEAIYSAKQYMNLNCLSVCLTDSSLSSAPLGYRFSTNHPIGIAGILNSVIFSKIKSHKTKTWMYIILGAGKCYIAEKKKNAVLLCKFHFKP